MELFDATNLGRVPTTDPFELPGPSDKLYWFGAAPQRFYQAHVVQKMKRQGDLLTFKFVHVTTAAVLATEHQVDLNDAHIVWRELPSTVQKAADGQFGFLFLRKDDAPDSLKAGIADSGGGTGKWPRTAFDETRRVLERIKKLRATTSNKSKSESLPPEIDEGLELIERQLRNLINAAEEAP